MSMRIDPGGEHHSACIKSLVVVLQHMCSLKKCKSELCSNTRRDWSIWLTAFFSYFFSHLGAFWCHPTTCENKGNDWRLLNVNHYFGCAYCIILLFL